MAVGSKRVLSEGEVRRLLEVVAEQPWRTLVELRLFVGLRRSEVLELLVDLVRNRSSREVPGVGWASVSAGLIGLVVLIIFGWAFQVLPGGHMTTTHGEPT
jgi:hypothetical protein